MAIDRGITEIADSEDEPLTSSPAAVADVAADKLSVTARQDAQAVAYSYQETAEHIANERSSHTDLLDADQEKPSTDLTTPHVDRLNVDAGHPSKTNADSTCATKGDAGAGLFLPHTGSEAQEEMGISSKHLGAAFTGNDARHVATISSKHSETEAGYSQTVALKSSDVENTHAISQEDKNTSDYLTTESSQRSEYIHNKQSSAEEPSRGFAGDASVGLTHEAVGCHSHISQNNAPSTVTKDNLCPAIGLSMAATREPDSTVFTNQDLPSEPATLATQADHAKERQARDLTSATLESEPENLTNAKRGGDDSTTVKEHDRSQGSKHLDGSTVTPATVIDRKYDSGSSESMSVMPNKETEKQDSHHEEPFQTQADVSAESIVSNTAQTAEVVGEQASSSHQHQHQPGIDDAQSATITSPDDQAQSQSTASQASQPVTPHSASKLTPQEITLSELKAQKAALLASLREMPVIQLLIEESQTCEVDMSDNDDEPTDADVTSAANKIVKQHIKLLHEYNELKDAGQGLMGLIADQRGVRIVEVQDEFGIDAND